VNGMIGSMLMLGDAAPAAAVALPAGPVAALAVVGLPLLACILTGLCAAFKVKSKLPAWITVVSLAAAFVAMVMVYQSVVGQGGGKAHIVHAFEWFNLSWGEGNGQRLIANFSFYIDSLTCLWMLFVTGLATLIALYASEYMSHDVGPGYCRFFAAFNLFVFSMACLVMADNLLLLYLGWEGVGLCSYLLIGYFYKKPSAVAAAKKAFIMNRIGDLGLALGIMLTFVQFGSVEFSVLFDKVRPFIELAREGRFAEIPMSVQAIALLLMVGCFGKSAQLPLYVWLPDAMEGPTPVSALIHAATMVTAGIYLVARFFPFFAVSEYALPTVAWVGTLTAVLAATIGMAQFDIKRIMAYSTVSQLGYMFAGLGVVSMEHLATMSPDQANVALAAGPYHVFTHAFFKALLFLSCGAVMHGFAGQLDLRKLSGVLWMPGWRIVGLAMLVGCINLAGVPFTAGFFSKDMILAEAFSNSHTAAIGWLLLLTAGLTAYYTFRVYFRVFLGPKHYEPGDELHAHDDHGHDHGHGDHGHGDHGHGDHGQARAVAPAAKHDHATHDFHPHPPGWAVNTVLATLAIASILAAGTYFIKWVPGLIATASTAIPVAVHAGHEASGHAAAHAHGTILGMDPHAVMYYVSGVVGAIGIFIAFLLHYVGRTTAATSKADALLPYMGPIPRWAQNKWYVDELYEFLVRVPLLVMAHVFHLIDKLIIDGLVDAVGLAPRGAGWSLRPSQGGVLHGYAASMAAGLGLILLLVMLVMR